jgi:excisionase family DNA binding protein
MDTPLALTLPEAAKALHVSEASARKLAAEGKLPVVRLGSRLTIVPVDALRAQLARALRHESGEPRLPD